MSVALPGLEAGAPPAPVATAGPCRVCGHLSWLLDEVGHVHLCCSLLPAGAETCLACITSEALNAGQVGRRARRR